MRALRTSDPPERVNERQLIARVLSGESSAELELYESHVDRVYRLAFRLAGDDSLARDFTQETFLRVFERLHDFRGDAALSTWIHRITVTVALNGLRKVRRLRARERDLGEAGEVCSRSEAVDPFLRERLHREIDSLPDRYRVAFLMHDVEGYTHEEISQVLEIATGTSKSLVSRARARLRGALQDLVGVIAL